MRTDLKFDHSMVEVRRERAIRLLIKLKREVVPGSSERNRVNIGLVIDRSGSMHGRKLEYVKEAAKNFIAQMKDDDTVSLVSFDDKVTVDLPAAPVKEHSRVAGDVIGRMHPGGSTFLSGGYEAGVKPARKMLKEEITSRVILLTDGEANVGETRLEALTGLAAAFQQNGVSTSTVGVGEGFNEQLLGAMAEAGQGNTYYIETPEEAHSVFEEELGYLMQIGARNVTVSFYPVIPGVALGQFNKYREQEPGKFLIGDLFGGRQRTLLLELGVPAQSQTGRLRLGEVQVNYTLIDGENVTGHSETFPLEVEVVQPGVIENVRPDLEVTKMLCNHIIAKIKEDVLMLLERGDYDRAAALVRETVARLRGFGIEDAELEREILDLQERSDMIAEYRHEYYIRDKKRLYYESSNVMSGKIFSNVLMEERRRSSGFDPLDEMKRLFRRKKS
ncbi:MAG: VWA domain-containing protein [Chlorobiota bacterium]|nr:MAG: VWA domain-containing protein [Chlorobiota bacterium]